MKRAAAGLACLLLAAAPAAAEQPVVVELFTSQGCAACPPTDALLNELAERDDVLALSMHVNYWDYLGWRDTFASAETTARQYAYRDAAGASIVYTPQIVVQGRPGASGNDRASIEAALDAADAIAPRMSVELVEMPGMVYAVLRPGPEPVEVTVWVVTYDRESTVDIQRGENRGRTITYRNVVRSVMRIGSWDGVAPLDVPMPQPGPGKGCAILLQLGEGGPILAAARIEG